MGAVFEVSDSYEPVAKDSGGKEISQQEFLNTLKSEGAKAFEKIKSMYPNANATDLNKLKEQFLSKPTNKWGDAEKSVYLKVTGEPVTPASVNVYTIPQNTGVDVFSKEAMLVGQFDTLRAMEGGKSKEQYMQENKLGQFAEGNKPQGQFQVAGGKTEESKSSSISTLPNGQQIEWYDPATGKPTPVGVGTYKKVTSQSEQPSNGLVWVKHPTLSLQLQMTPEAAQAKVDQGWSLIGDQPISEQELKNIPAGQQPTKQPSTSLADMSKEELGDVIAGELGFKIDDQLKPIWDMMVDQLKVLESLGKTINPDIEIDETTLKDFEATVANNLDPQFKQKFDLAKEKFEAGIDVMAQQHAAEISSDEKSFQKNLASARENFAQRGLIFSGIREQAEKELATGYEESQKQKELSFQTKAKEFGQPYEEFVGTPAFESFKKLDLPSVEQAKLGLQPGFQLGAPKTLDIGYKTEIPFGELDVSKALAKEQQMAKLKELKGQEIGLKLL